ncbi:Uncharacterised protein [Legionella pneumophila]|nr:Uncharacterised protein [Legionella pneumophila]
MRLMQWRERIQCFQLADDLWSNQDTLSEVFSAMNDPMGYSMNFPVLLLLANPVQYKMNGLLIRHALFQSD